MKNAAVIAYIAMMIMTFHGCTSSTDPENCGGGAAPDTIPPLVTITSPLDGSEMPDLLDIVGTVTDETAVDTVLFELRDLCGTSLWSDFDDYPAYDRQLDASVLPDGEYRVCAAACDRAGNMSGWTCVTVSKGTIAAQIDRYWPCGAYSGREIAAIGTGFGTNPGSVTVLGHEAVVTGWTDTEVTFVIPDAVPADATVGMELLVDCRWSAQGEFETTPQNIIKITDDIASDKYPCWGMDGDKIYFATTRVGNWDIWRVSLDDGNLDQVTVYPGLDTQPHVSRITGDLAWISNRDLDGYNPDGDNDVFSASIGYNGEISDLEIRTLTNDTNMFPHWSPDIYMGYELLYGQLCDPEDDGSTYPVIFAQNGAGVADTVGTGIHGSFSPDGSWVVYENGECRLCKIEIGAEADCWFTYMESDHCPDWGYANDTIVFSRFHDTHYQLFTLDTYEQLLDLSWQQVDPAWSWDCTKIVFSGFRNGNHDIYIYEIP